MKTSFELNAEFRDDQGKGASRRLRHLGKIPAILYGGHREPRALALDHTRTMLVLENEKVFSTILLIKVGDATQAAILKDMQRHPYKNQIRHIDFQRVEDNETIRLTIPLHFTGEAIAPGVKVQGGVVSHLRSDIEVSCLPKDLPEFIEVDVSGLSLNQTLKLSELKLPQGVELPELNKGRDPVVVSVHALKAQVEETPVAEAAAAAPAAAAAAPAAAAKAEPAKKEGGKK
ncbi:MAG: 50S ribosomal protein L25/general stress protein Ctc [Gammaproteobacteria bacterium]|jgi:large subunit ribosomal protein L25|nr:50S ribosomal protein L25/general stress protein Ctc [Gammaproteobacteria bacterium]